MASLIAPAIGIGMSIFGGEESAADTSELDLTGYNYLTKGAGLPTIKAAQDAGMAASTGAGAAQTAQAELLGLKPITDQTKTAFGNYLNSTGYNFQMDQGSRAVAGSAAAKGLLNSGATAKALTKFGQNLGSNYFTNYLGQLGKLNDQQNATAAQGIDATIRTGAAGTQGGIAAGANTQRANESRGNALATAGGIAAEALTNNYDNWFS